MTATTFSDLTETARTAFVDAADAFVNRSSLGDRVEDVEVMDSMIVYSLDCGGTVEVQISGRVYVRAADASDDQRLFLGSVKI